MTAAAAMSMRYLHLAAFKLFHSTLFCDIISGCINHQLDVYPMAMEFFFFLTQLGKFFFSFFLLPTPSSWHKLCARASSPFVLSSLCGLNTVWKRRSLFNPANAGVWLLRFDYSSPHTCSFLTRGQISWCTKLARGKDLCKVAPTGHVHQTWYAWPNGLLPCIHCSIS